MLTNYLDELKAMACILSKELASIFLAFKSLSLKL